ncbi:MAG TPA: biotin/lipoyl-containing protein [Vicinamibacteria bacterium]|nr:biotin/lipoyl-containing protein [Vicinamibacteria bacterium]
MIFDATVAGRSYRVEVKASDARYVVSIDGRPLTVDWHPTGGVFASLIIDGQSQEVGVARGSGGYAVVLDDASLLVELAAGAAGAGSLAKKGSAGPAKVTAPMPGKIVRLLAEPGQLVAAGQGLVVMEAMKMENELPAPHAGRIKAIEVREGQAVETGALLVVME